MVKKLPANAGDVRDAGLIPGLERSPGGGARHPLQCSRLEKPMDRGAWQTRVHGVAHSVHGVAQSWTRLKRLSTHFSELEAFQGMSHLVSSGGLAINCSLFQFV